MRYAFFICDRLTQNTTTSITVTMMMINKAPPATAPIITPPLRVSDPPPEIYNACQDPQWYVVQPKNTRHV